MAEYMINESVVNAVQYDRTRQNEIKNFLSGLDYKIVTERHPGGLSKVVIDMPGKHIEVHEGHYLVKESDGSLFTVDDLNSLSKIELL